MELPRTNAPALHYFDRTLTWRELAAFANAFAAALAARGIGPGDRVALLLQNTPQLVIGLLGTWRAGAVAVPLNPMYTGELPPMLADCGARLLVRHASLAVDFADAITAADTEFGDDDFMRFLATGLGRPTPAAASELAALLYTSGTTGPAKAALITHAGLRHSAAVYRDWFHLDERDVILGLAPLFHVTGLVAHLCTAIATGAPLVLSHRFHAGQVLRLVEKWRASFAIAPFTAYLALCDHPDFGHRDHSSLRKLATGGAPVARATAERVRAAFGVPLHNVYGLTETTSPSHAVPLGSEPRIDAATGAVSIGLPVPGAEARIHDPDEAGIGEIAIRGPMVVPGYWNRPDETARAIRDGWLHTGDLGTRDADGWFYVVDRQKDLIIASGFKIWPREVEEVLYQHPAVRESCVVGIPDDYRSQTVKAFVSLRAPASPDELAAFCRARLAAYKVPRVIEVVDHIPKTESGKLLRRALRA